MAPDLSSIYAEIKEIHQKINRMAEYHDNPWLRSSEYAEHWHVSIKTFWRGVKNGSIESHPAMANEKIKLYRRRIPA